MNRVVTVYRRPVLMRKAFDGRVSQRETHWQRCRALEARDVEVLGVFWPRVHLDFGSGGVREFSLHTGRGISSMVDWTLKPEDMRVLRVEYAPAAQKKRREKRSDGKESPDFRPG